MQPPPELPASFEFSTLAQSTEAKLSERIYPWIVVLICGAFLVYKYVLQIYPSIMTKELMEAFQVHGLGLGNLAAFFFYSYLITQLFVGILLDKFSTRYLGTFAVLVCALGAYLFSIAHSITLAIIARTMMGFGAAFATVCYMKIATIWFKQNQFAFISGFLATAAMLGAVFGQAPLSFVTSYLGWRETLLVCCFLGLFIAALFILVVRDAPKNSHGKSIVKYNLTWDDVLTVLKNKQNWLLTFYSGLAFSPVAVFGGLWGNPFLELTYHLNRTEAATLISLVFIGLAVGAPILGWLSDYVIKKRMPVMFAGTIFSLFSILIVIYFNSLPTWLITMLLFGFGFGTSAFMLCFAVGKDLNPLGLAATVIALINTGDAILGSITEPLIGRLLDLGAHTHTEGGAPYFTLQDYHSALVVLPIYLILALIILIFVRERKTHP